MRFGREGREFSYMVPDFFGEASLNTWELQFGFAAAGSTPEVKHNQNKLTVQGVRCESLVIATVWRSALEGHVDEWKPKNTASMIRDFWELLPKHGDCDFNRQLSSLCRVLVSGSSKDSYIPPSERLLSSSQFESSLLEVLKNASLDNTRETHGFLVKVRDLLQGRCLFITNDSKFGLGPKGVRYGDSVYVLLGADHPFILRSSEGKDEHQVLGPCYLSELMNGEALLGPLPSNQKYVRKYVSFGYHDGFLDNDTGKILYDDPRLGPLRKEWRRRAYGNEDWEIMYFNEGTGERRYPENDPRLTSKALKERGIKIEDIVLV